jgi:hypothetical protein
MSEATPSLLGRLRAEAVSGRLVRRGPAFP